MNSPYNKEIILWKDMFQSRRQSKLDGVKITLDDLTEIFHAEQSKTVVFEDVTQLEDSALPYKIYGRKTRYKNTRVGFFERLAYECTSIGCNKYGSKLIVGPPAFYELNDPSGTCGVQGYVVFLHCMQPCHGCRYCIRARTKDQRMMEKKPILSLNF